MKRPSAIECRMINDCPVYSFVTSTSGGVNSSDLDIVRRMRTNDLEKYVHHLEKKLEDFLAVAEKAVEHVAYANYHERRMEAMHWIREHAEK